MQWLQCIHNLWYLWIFESQAHNHKIEFRGPPHLHKPSVFHRFLNNDRISRFYLYVRPSRNSYCLMSTRAASTCCLCVCLCHQWHANCENPPHFTALFSFAFSLSRTHLTRSIKDAFFKSTTWRMPPLSPKCEQRSSLVNYDTGNVREQHVARWKCAVGWVGGNCSSRSDTHRADAVNLRPIVFRTRKSCALSAHANLYSLLAIHARW